MIRFKRIRLVVTSRQKQRNETCVDLIGLGPAEGGSFAESCDKDGVDFHERVIVLFKEDLEIDSIMSCGFKSYPFFLGQDLKFSGH